MSLLRRTRRGRGRQSQPGQEHEAGSEKRKSRSARRRERHRHLLLTLVFVAAISVAAAVCMILFGLPAPIQARMDIRPDEQAMDGTLHTAEGEVVEEGQYWVLLNQLPTLESGSRDCNIEFENPKENQYSARLTLYLASNGRRIGGTRRVDPGKYVEMIELTRTLDSGEHPVQARIELFDESRPVGIMTLGITLRVLEA